jgi:hypothetical protein
MEEIGAAVPISSISSEGVSRQLCSRFEDLSAYEILLEKRVTR